VLETEIPRRLGHRFGGGLLVALGWYATLIAAAVVAGLGSPTRPSTPQDCDVSFNCGSSSVRFAVVLAIVFGLPLLFTLTAVAMLMLAWLVRVLPSALVAGTIAAWSSLGILAGGVGLWAAAR
jgi:hypothetical protein